MIPLPRDGWPVVRAGQVVGVATHAPAPAHTPPHLAPSRAASPAPVTVDIADMVENIDRTLREGL